MTTEDPIERLIRMAGPRPDASEDRRARVRRNVHQRWRELVDEDAEPRRRPLVLAAGLLATAGLLGAVAVGARLWMRAHESPATAATILSARGILRFEGGRAAEAGALLPEGARVTTGPDGAAAIALSGTTQVRLDASTGARLVTARILALERGALYVDTGTAASGAVEVRTPVGLVRDVGTRFQVRLAGDGVEVSVRDGAAVLERRDAKYAVPERTRLRAQRDGPVVSEPIPSSGGEWSWTLAAAPPFELEGRTLVEYLDWLSHETGWSIGFGDETLRGGAAGIVLHGSTKGLRPDETPAAVFPTCGLKHRLDGDRLIVERAGS